MGWRKMRIHFQSFTQLFQRLVNPARHEQPASEGIVDRQGQRVKVPGTLGLGDPLLKSPYIHQITGVPVVSPGITGVEFQSALVFPLGRCPIPLMSLDDECERCVRFGESVIHCDGFQRRCLRSRQGVFRRKTAAKPKQRVGVSQAAIRQGVARVSGDCLLEIRDAFVQRVLRSLVEVVPALQVVLVSFGVHRLRSCQIFLLLAREADLSSLGDAPRDLLL